ncbi:MAG TPA: hypothetical protein VMD02_02375 [Candidatus Omnitrophota bacterium]|nr:hypothetical protein [Candidatus Omnitrophota bacterium]
MDIGKAFVDSWNVYIKNFIIIFLAGIVASILGFLVAPYIGAMTMFVKAKKGGSIGFGDVFAPFSKFINLFFGAIWIGILLMLCWLPAVVCFYLSWNAIGMILSLAALIADIYLGVCWMYSLLMVYDKGISVNDSLKASRELVTKNNFWMHLLLLILAGIVGGIGSILFQVGVLLTLPLGMGAIACAYAEEAK